MAELFERWEQSGDAEAERLLRGALTPSPTRFSPQEVYPRSPRPGKRGYLLFENPESELNKRFVDGQELTRLLVETDVPVLVLNACRSAYAEAREGPKASGEDADQADSRAERAWGSLAQELMDSGVGGVVAMRYNVYVVTAARFIAELYGSLARGRTLGAAVALGRKHLHDKPLREVVADPLPLQDWQVPIVYEAAPIALFPEPDGGGELKISLGDASTVAADGLDPTLPPTPDAGFWGRDETLLALDRAFDNQSIVLLHAYAGSGKTATAAEFARWYALTGGVEGPVGLLTRHGGGYYSIHPALPWFFRGLFERFYNATKEAALRAFAEAVGMLGDYYWGQYEDGNCDVISALRAEEVNLLQTCRLARVHGWWDLVVRAMQGLRILYRHTGRRAEWRQLVEGIVPNFVDPKTEGPLPGREDGWSLVAQYRVQLTREERKWDKAERLQQVQVDLERQRVAPVFELPRASLDSSQRHAVRTLAASLHELGDIRRELGHEDCVVAYEESLNLLESIGERAMAAVCAFNLGHVYKNISALCDFRQAERWYRRSLELRDERDQMGRGGCLAQLGAVAFERFQLIRKRKRPEDELLRHLNEAVSFYHQALEHFPTDAAVDELGAVHAMLGGIYGTAGDLDRAMPHFRDAIRYREKQGNAYEASKTRFNVAIALDDDGRPQDALEYARAALRGFETYGESAADMIQTTRQLIEQIQQNL